MFFPHSQSFPEVLRLGVEPYIKEGDALARVELSDFARHILKYQMRDVWVVRSDLKSNQDLNSEYVIRSHIPVYAPEPAGDIGSMKGYKGPTNQAVHGLVGTFGTVHAQWKGDILIAKRFNRPEISVELLDEEPGWEDLTPGDAKILKDLFMEYGNEDLDRAFPKARKTAPGLKMTCKGDQRAFGQKLFEPVDIPLDYPIWEQKPAQISERIGFPVYVRRYKKDQVWIHEGRLFFEPTQKLWD